MEQMRLLMDYTRFHIGVYITLGAAGAGTIKAGVFCVSELLAGICLLVVAGMCGGVVGSSIPLFSTWSEFDRARLKVFFIQTWR